MKLEDSTALQRFERLAEVMGVDVAVLLKEGYRLFLQDLRKRLDFPRNLQVTMLGDYDGTLSLTGTNQQGEAVTEVISLEGRKTFFSKTAFSKVHDVIRSRP